MRLDDEWETFSVRFRVHINEYHPNADMRLIIKDTAVREGGGKIGDGYRMTSTPQPYDWLRNKYGVPVKPWERTLKLRNDENDSAGQFRISDGERYLYYNYMYTNGATG